MSVFKHVLAATDFSEASAAALDTAISMALEGGAALTVMTVCEIPAMPEALPPVDFLTMLGEATASRLEKQLTEVRRRYPAARGLVRTGAAWEEIVAAVRETGADLVVLGTHGRRGVAHVVLGSVAERVVRLSPVPVLTVRAGPAAPARPGTA